MKINRKRYILALDQGTTSSRAVLVDKKGTVFAAAQKEFKQIFPQPGWVEHDPVEIWASQYEVAREVIKNNGVDSEYHCRDRHYQPAGDDGCLGPKHRQALI